MCNLFHFAASEKGLSSGTTRGKCYGKGLSILRHFLPTSYHCWLAQWVYIHVFGRQALDSQHRFVAESQ